MKKLFWTLMVMAGLAMSSAMAKARYPVGYRASCVKVGTPYTGATVIDAIRLVQRDLLRLRGEGWFCKLERSDDLGKTWRKCGDDGTPEGA